MLLLRVEAVATTNSNKIVTTEFLYQDIVTRFGLPQELVSEQGSHFLNGVIKEMIEHYKIKHRFATPCYPQCNGQA